MSAARDDITVYWGVASGSSHAAFRRHYEDEEDYQDAPVPTHLMINWRTVNNQVWAGPNWMIDSGGAPDTIIANSGHPDTVHDYLDYVERPPIKYGDDRADVTVDQFALRDWPCEPNVRNALGMEVEELQHRTLVDHINTLEAYENRDIDAEPVAVLQGWDVQDYLHAIDMFRDHGLLTDRIAIGTLCGRTDVQVIQNTAFRVARNLPSRCTIHGFGVKQSALGAPDALRIFDSVDTLAWDQSIRQATKTGVEVGPPGGTYDDWVEWDDDGNPRYTARNLWINYRAYANRLAEIDPVHTPSDMRVVTLDQLFKLAGKRTPGGMRVDEYVVAQCLCGKILDPGRPDPLPGGAGCRHCERFELDIFDQRLAREEEIIHGPEGAEEDEGGLDQEIGPSIQHTLEGMVEERDEQT